MSAEHSGSLARRLILIAAGWSLAVLALAGIVLSENYTIRAQEQFAAVGNVYLLNLIAGFEIGKDGVARKKFDFGDPRFELYGSGYSWQVSRGDEKILISPSRGGTFLVTPAAETLPFDEGFQRVLQINENGRDLLVLQRLVVVGEGPEPLRFTVAMPLADLESDIASFQRSLLLFLTVFALGLLVTLVLIVHFGLRPLRALRQSVEAVITGEVDRVRGTFPTEISPIRDEINRLIDHNHRVVDRARSHVGNLAHALKTPLSVIINEVVDEKGETAQTVRDQATAVRRLVDYHLERARMIAVAANPGLGTDVEPVVAGIIRAMKKIHRGRDLSLRVDVEPKLRFRGDARDLEEMLGNLVDNACKWAHSTVEVRALVAANDPQRMRISVEDDGPGLPQSDRAAALQRGKRLDEKTPGTGLGLSIVVDLAEAYDGRLQLDRAEAGGLHAVLDLPGGLLRLRGQE